VPMNFLIFGLERPKLSFEQDPERGTVIRCDNKYVLDYDPREPITWRKIAYRPIKVGRLRRVPLPHESSEQEWQSVIEELKTLCQTDAERIFLDKIGQA